MSNAREDSAAGALSLLGLKNFETFVRAIRSDSISPLAVKLVNEQLDAGETVQELFFTGKQYGFGLSVTEKMPHHFDVEFGYQAGPLAGDGGTWEVVIDRDGELVRVLQTGLWES